MVISEFLFNLDFGLIIFCIVGWGVMEIFQFYYSGQNQINLNVNEDKQDGFVIVVDLVVN